MEISIKAYNISIGNHFKKNNNTKNNTKNAHNEIDPISSAMEVAVTKLKKRNKIIRIANNADTDWSQVLYRMYFLGSNSDNYCKVCQAEARVIEKRSICTITPLSTFRNPKIFIVLKCQYWTLIFSNSLY